MLWARVGEWLPREAAGASTLRRCACTHVRGRRLACFRCCACCLGLLLGRAGAAPAGDAAKQALAAGRHRSWRSTSGGPA